jgi:hypothetical protein
MAMRVFKNHPYCVVHHPLIPLFESSSIQVKIPLKESLSIYPFVGKKVEESPPSIYLLRGVVHHVGRTASSGHYTTCGKRFICGEKTTGPPKNEEQWMLFDGQVGTKTSVNYVTDNESNQRSCYMALYELAEAKATVETDDSTLKEALQHTTLLQDSDDNPPAINEAAASIHVNDPENDRDVGENRQQQQTQQRRPSFGSASGPARPPPSPAAADVPGGGEMQRRQRTKKRRKLVGGASASAAAAAQGLTLPRRSPRGASQQQALKEAESNAAESVAAVQQNTENDSVQTPVETPRFCTEKSPEGFVHCHDTDAEASVSDIETKSDTDNIGGAFSVTADSGGGPEPTEMAMLPPEPDADDPLPISTAPPLVLPSPEAEAKLPPLLVDGDPEAMDKSPPAAKRKRTRGSREKNWMETFNQLRKIKDEHGHFCHVCMRKRKLLSSVKERWIRTQREKKRKEGHEFDPDHEQLLNHLSPHILAPQTTCQVCSIGRKT